MYINSCLPVSGGSGRSSVAPARMLHQLGQQDPCSQPISK